VRAWPFRATVLAHAGDDRGHHLADGTGLRRDAFPAWEQQVPGPISAGASVSTPASTAMRPRSCPAARQEANHGRGFRQDRDIRAPGLARPGAQLILEDDEAHDLQGGALVIWAGPDIKPGTRPRPRAFAGGGQCLPRCFFGAAAEALGRLDDDGRLHSLAGDMTSAHDASSWVSDDAGSGRNQ